MSSVVVFLNQHKEAIKNVAGIGSFIIGGKAAYDALSGRIYTEYAPNYATNDLISKDTANKVALAFAQVSFVLSAAVSPLGMLAISKVVNRTFTSAQLASVFGPNTTFATNWTHPRHIVTLVAAGLAIPLVVKRLFITPSDKEKPLLGMAAFTLLTSRPVLHHANQLARRLFLRS